MPIPRMPLPTINIIVFCAIPNSIAPTVKTMLPIRVVIFLPKTEFRNPLTSANTIAAAIVTLTMISCVKESNANSSLSKSIAPETTPVSYPNRNPPMVAKKENSFFNASGESIDRSNSFHTLSDFSDKPNDSIASTNNNLTANETQHKRSLRIISVNCRSLINNTKHIDLQNLIETHNPDIILGCVSHLDSQIASSEVFPKNYSNPYRKYRKLGAGGVFIAAKNDLVTTVVYTITDCEIMWATLNVQGSNQIYT
ncbi:unnamed protein product [Mytilus coruscus]|uniref:Endonuclease/exonuclease/phosphatase domain-containing protein n=1 Tax=Mytilus coruscus TaxID=42192 RepID=A0A6J8EHX0_MYTCO|nr:unnamed protein product [Mytilus coruscus]